MWIPHHADVCGLASNHFEIPGMLILVKNFQRSVDRRVVEPQNRLDEMKN
jgi:hypothetical protein